MNFLRSAPPPHMPEWLARVLLLDRCRSNATRHSSRRGIRSTRAATERVMASHASGHDVTPLRDSSLFRRIRSFVPIGYKEESIKLVKLAGPVVSRAVFVKSQRGWIMIIIIIKKRRRSKQSTSPTPWTGISLNNGHIWFVHTEPSRCQYGFVLGNWNVNVREHPVILLLLFTGSV